jgi:hypothetical protein
MKVGSTPYDSQAVCAFDDDHGFKQDVAKRRRDARVITSEHFKAPREFGFGANPESDTTRERFERFRSLKPIFVVAIETGRRGRRDAQSARNESGRAIGLQLGRRRGCSWRRSLRPKASIFRRRCSDGRDESLAITG